MPLAFPVYTEQQKFQANPNDEIAEPPCLTLAFPGCPSSAAEIRVDLNGVQDPCSRKHRSSESSHSVSCTEKTADVVNLSDHEASPSSSCHKDDPSSQTDSEDTFKMYVPTSSGDRNNEHALILKSHRAVPIIPGFTICSCGPREVTTCAAPEYSLSQKRFPCNARLNPALAANCPPPSRRRSSERGLDTRNSSSQYLARSKSVERTQHRPKLENRFTGEETESSCRLCESFLSTTIKAETDHVTPSQPTVWGDSIHGDTPSAVPVYYKTNPDREKKQNHKFSKDKSLLHEVGVEQLNADVLTCCSPMLLQVTDISNPLKPHRSPPTARPRVKGSRTIDQMFVDVMRILVSLESKVSHSSETLDNKDTSEAPSSEDKDQTANHGQAATQTDVSSTAITTATASNTDCSNPSSLAVDQSPSEGFLCGSACTGAFSSLDCSEGEFILNPERQDSDEALCSLCATKNQSSLVIDINNCRWFDDDDVVENGETFSLLDNGSSSDEASNDESNEDPRSSPGRKEEPQDDEMKGPSVRDMVRTFQGMMAAPCTVSGTSAEQADIRPPKGDIVDSQVGCFGNLKSVNFWSEHQDTPSPQRQDEHAKKIPTNTSKLDFDTTQELSTSHEDQTLHITVKDSAMARREHHDEKPLSTKTSQEVLYRERASSATKGFTEEATVHEQEETSNTHRSRLHDEVCSHYREKNEKAQLTLTQVDRTTAVSHQRNEGCSHRTRDTSNLQSTHREPFSSISESSHVPQDNFPFLTAAELRDSAQACLERARATFNRVRSRSFSPMISGFLDRAQKVKASAQKSWARTTSFRELPFDVFPARASEVFPVPGSSCFRADSATTDSESLPRNNRVAEDVESGAVITTPAGSLGISGDDNAPKNCLEINYSSTEGEERPLFVVQQESGTSGGEVNRLQDVGDLEKDHRGLVGRQTERDEPRDIINGKTQQEKDSKPGCSSCSTKTDLAPKKPVFKRCKESFTVQPSDHRSRALDLSSVRLRTPPLMSIKETDSPSEEIQTMHQLDRRQSSPMDKQNGFNTLISPDTEANSDERRHLHSYPSNASINLLSESSLRIGNRSSLTPVKSHSLIETTDIKRPEADDVKEVMTLINEEVHLKRYPSFHDLTNLDSLDLGVASTLDPLLSISMAKIEPTESVLVKSTDSPVASEPLQSPCIKAELDIELQEKDGNIMEPSLLMDAEFFKVSTNKSLPEESLSTLGQDELFSIDSSKKDQFYRDFQHEKAELQYSINNKTLTVQQDNKIIPLSIQPGTEQTDGQIVPKCTGTPENLVKIVPTTDEIANLLPDLPSPPSHSLSDISWEDEADFFRAELPSDACFFHDIEGNLIQSTSRALPEAFPLFNRTRRHVVATVPKTGYPFQEENSSGLASIDSTLDSISLDDKQLLDNSDLTPLVHSLGGLHKDDSENSDLSLITLNCMEYLRDAQEPKYSNLNDEGTVGIISTDDDSRSLEELVDPVVEIPPASAPHREAQGMFPRRSTETMSLTDFVGSDSTLKRRGQSHTTLMSSQQNENKTSLITSSLDQPQDQPPRLEINSRELTSALLSPKKSSTETQQLNESSKLDNQHSSSQQVMPDMTTSLHSSPEDIAHEPSVKSLLVIKQLSPRTTKSNSFASPPENYLPEINSQRTSASGFSSGHQQELVSSDVVLPRALTDSPPASAHEHESHKTHQNVVNPETTCLNEPEILMVSSSGCSSHLPSALRSSRDPVVDAVGPAPEGEPRRKSPKRIRWLEDTENNSEDSS